MKAPNIKEFIMLHDNVLVESVVIEEKDGIYTPQSYDDKPELGTVLSVGNGRLLDTGTRSEILVKVGDLVYFNKYSTKKFNLDGKDYFVIREEDIDGYKR